MACTGALGWLAKTSAAFRSAREGNVAIIFGLSLIPSF
jgi:hypothetical protein